jgi:hypothetical protein
MSSELLGAAHHILRTHVIVGVRRTVSYVDGGEMARPVESFLSFTSGSVLRRHWICNADRVYGLSKGRSISIKFYEMITALYKICSFRIDF